MNPWILTQAGFDPEKAAADGSRFLTANGYMGLRGAPEEADRALCPAVTLAGVYDQAGSLWREPVNAPNPLFAFITFNGRPLALGRSAPLRHTLFMDCRHGVLSRETDFGPLLIKSRRYVSMAACHLMADRITLSFHEDGCLQCRCGISTDIWDLNGPHFDAFRLAAGDALLTEGATREKGILVAAAQAARLPFEADWAVTTDGNGVYRCLKCPVKAGSTLEIDLFAAVYTSLDTPSPGKDASALCLKAREEGFDAVLRAHKAAWEDIWTACEVEMEGPEDAAAGMHNSQYHLNAVAPRHADDLSIPARGLSGQTYKGAIFWDSEIFFFPMFVYTQPEIARSLLRYRIKTLPGARMKAAEYGFRGAFYAWESQEGGREGCTDFNVVDVFTHRPVRTYFRDKQIHISADIVYALTEYHRITGDRSLLKEGGAEVILECARFYLSRASCHMDTPQVDFADVIGPDEYHERVTNNFFTNLMIRHCLSAALSLEEKFRDEPGWYNALLDRLNIRQDLSLIRQLLPRIRGGVETSGVIEQFDGYFALEDCSLSTVRSRLKHDREYWGGDHGVAGPTRIIKQADVIAAMALFPDEFSDESVRLNFDYYEPRTEHGSSLSACMYALCACRIGALDRAWELFLKTATIDITGGGKQYAGDIYIGGTHPASNGGAWMIAALGFAGLSVQNGALSVSPRLPKQISRLRFPIVLGGRRHIITIAGDGSYSIEEG